MATRDARERRQRCGLDENKKARAGDSGHDSNGATRWRLLFFLFSGKVVGMLQADEDVGRALFLIILLMARCYNPQQRTRVTWPGTSRAYMILIGPRGRGPCPL